MTRSEQLVGRRLPAHPRHIDTVMASFIKTDGTLCGKLEPSESWLKAAFKKARKNRWIVYSGIRIGFGERKSQSSGLWYLSETGETEARAAAQRVREINEARDQWSRDFRDAHRDAAAKKTGAPE